MKLERNGARPGQKGHFLEDLALAGWSFGDSTKRLCEIPTRAATYYISSPGRENGVVQLEIRKRNGPDPAFDDCCHDDGESGGAADSSPGKGGPSKRGSPEDVR